MGKIYSQLILYLNPIVKDTRVSSQKLLHLLRQSAPYSSLAESIAHCQFCFDLELSSQSCLAVASIFHNRFSDFVDVPTAQLGFELHLATATRFVSNVKFRS